MITKKNNIYKRRKNLFTRKRNFIGGASQQVFSNGEINQEFVDRFTFFEDYGKFYKKFSKYQKKFNKLYSKVDLSISRSGNVVSGGKIDIDDDFGASNKNKIQELYNYQQTKYEEYIRNEVNINNTTIYFGSVHGAYNKKNYNYIDIPDNTAICFLSPLDYNSIINKLDLKLKSKNIYRFFQNLSIAEFTEICHSQAKINYSNNHQIDKIEELLTYNYYKDCFKNSTWYYPKQKCLNLELQFQYKDYTHNFYIHKVLPHKYYIKDNLIKKEIFTKLNEYIKIALTNNINYDFDLSDYIEKVNKDNINLTPDTKNFNIIIIPGCRGLDPKAKSENKFILAYETIIHFINIKISQESTKKLFLYTDCGFSNNLTYFDYSYINKELYYESDPNFSRYTAELIRIFNDIIKKGIDSFTEIYKKGQFSSKTIKDIPNIITDNELFLNTLRYIADIGVNKIYLFIVKIYKYIKKKGLPDIYFFKFMINFIIVNIDKIEHIFTSLLNSKMDIISLYNSEEENLEDFKQNINKYITFYSLILYSLKYIIINKDIYAIGEDKILFFYELINNQDIKGMKELLIPNLSFNPKIDDIEKKIIDDPNKIRDLTAHLFNEIVIIDNVNIVEIETNDNLYFTKEIKIVNCNIIEFNSFISLNLFQVVKLSIINTELNKIKNLDFSNFIFLENLLLQNNNLIGEIKFTGGETLTKLKFINQKHIQKLEINLNNEENNLIELKDFFTSSEVIIKSNNLTTLIIDGVNLTNLNIYNRVGFINHLVLNNLELRNNNLEELTIFKLQCFDCIFAIGLDIIKIFKNTSKIIHIIDSEFKTKTLNVKALINSIFLNYNINQLNLDLILYNITNCIPNTNVGQQNVLSSIDTISLDIDYANTYSLITEVGRYTGLYKQAKYEFNRKLII